MIALVAELLPYLFLFYLLDGLVVVRRHQWLLAADRPRRFRRLGPGLHLAGALPTSTVFLVEEPPAVLTAGGVQVPRRDRLPLEREGEPAVTPFEALGPLAVDGRRILAGGAVLVEAATAAGARRWRSLASELRDLEPGARASRLAALASEANDLEAVRGLHRRLAPHLPRLRVLSAILFLAGFVLPPIGLGLEDGDGRPAVVYAALAAGGALWAAILALGLRALRGCGVTGRAALSAASPMLLFPPAAIHACSFLFRDLFSGFDPLAVAAALLPSARFRGVARRALQGLAAARDGAADVSERRRWELELGAAETVVRGAGTSPAEVLAAPARRDPSAGGYCPRCEVEYRPGFTSCSDCRVELEAFADP
jgi:hypothetical protein